MSTTPPDRTPVVVTCGLDATDQVLAGIGIQWALPKPVVIRHELDVAQGTVRRVVSDATGVLENVWILLDHACATCAFRLEIIPTLIRLVELRRWSSVVVCLPPTVTPAPLVQVLESVDDPRSRLAQLVDIRSVVTVLRGGSVVEDVFGDDLLCERHPALDHDRRAVGEVLAEQVEYADVLVAVDETLDHQAQLLLRELVRPEARIVSGATALDADVLLTEGRDARAARRFVDPTRRRPSGRPELHAWGDCEPPRDVSRDLAADVWTLYVDTWKPLHPTRLLENIHILGGGALRGRGCFWLPTRPGAVAAWHGAGGQLSIGTTGAWGTRRPRTRLVMTGLGPGRAEVARALADTLATEAELAAGRDSWGSGEDGFELWLGEYPATG